MCPKSTRCCIAIATPAASSEVTDGMSALALRRLTSTIGVDAAASSSSRGCLRWAVANTNPSTLRCRNDSTAAFSTSGSVVGVDDPGVVSDRAQHVLDPAHDGREQRVGQIGDHQADAGRPGRPEAAGDRVRRVADLRGYLLDPSGGLGVDQAFGLLVQGARRGGGMDARHDRNLPQRGPSHRTHDPLRSANGCSIRVNDGVHTRHVQYNPRFRS